MLAAEGFWFMFVPMLLFLGGTFLGVWKKKPGLFPWAGLFLVLWFGMMYFFRDPARPQPDVSDLVAPTDGVVDVIDHTDDGRVRLQVYLSLFDVHAIRSPASGQVTGREFIPGKFLSALSKESIDANQRITATLATAYGPLEFSAISGAIARRVLMPLEGGETVLAGQRIGFVRFGSRSEIVLPHGVDAAVSVGDRVIGGVTVIGDLRTGQHHSPTSRDPRLNPAAPPPSDAEGGALPQPDEPGEGTSP